MPPSPLPICNTPDAAQPLEQMLGGVMSESSSNAGSFATLSAAAFAIHSSGVPTHAAAPTDDGASGASGYTASVKRAMSMGIPPPSDVPSSFGIKDDVYTETPKGLDKWNWLLKHMCCACGAPLGTGSGVGSEKKTAAAYAANADEQGNTTMGDALRIRETRHSDCEVLTIGCFNTRNFSTLHADLNEMKHFVTE